MDKRTAKREALKIWKWLSEHDGKSKIDYAVDVDRGILDLHCLCPLCQYLIGDTNKGCRACPLWYEDKDSGCSTRPSPFRKWDFEGHRAEDAKKVYDLIKAWKVR